jgi:hypothetical protein
MTALNYTLVADGTSDKALMPILNWLLKRLGVACPVNGQWADFRQLPKRPVNLKQRIVKALEIYPCDVLFVHRDAEREPPENRVSEIERAVSELAETGNRSIVPVVPVRMQESWLLTDERSIRFAASNPNGNEPLQLPRLREVETLPNPKTTLDDLLKNACGRTGRRLKKFNFNQARVLVSNYTTDFSPLCELPAFKTLSIALKLRLRENGWIDTVE